MIPDILTMIADIASWLERPHTLEIWYDPDGYQFGVSVMGEIWRHYDLEKCLFAAWSDCDKKRSDVRPFIEAELDKLPGSAFSGEHSCVQE
jgi:hypothetical protein